MAGWKRNLYVLTGAELVAVAGFSVVMPFMAYFVQDLGVTDPEQVKLWTGWLFSSHAIVMAIAAPIWGSLADRYGRKMMVERAMFGGALVFLGMGFATSVGQLLVLRTIQGALTGTVPAATALVASTAPREHSGSSQGTLQTGIYLGASVGPLVGGVTADLLGYRAAFWVTSACLALAWVSVRLFVNEGESEPEWLAGRRDSHLWDGLLLVLASPLLRMILAIRFVERLGSRVVQPMLPLFIQEIAPDAVRLATTTGVIAGLSALASAIGSFVLGRAADRVGLRKMLVLSSIGMALSYVLQIMVGDPVHLGALQFAAGFMMAGVLASVSALLATWVPEGRQGAVYGVSTTIVAAANALASMLGASVAVWWGLRSIFTVAAILFGCAVMAAASLFFAPAFRDEAERV
jgi:DHA1 family multidrug resistance protein-like MFS transporter